MQPENMSHTPTEHGDPFGLRKPDWEKWKSAKTAKIWQAIALACDLDPSNFGIFEMMGWLDRQGLAMKHPSFAKLLDWARHDLGPNGRLQAISPCADNLEDCEVSLSGFATWLTAAKHRPPKEFPWLPEDMPTSNLDWPWGRHETDLLRKLAAAAAKFWKNYDPDDPSTAPTNQEVSAWLQKQGVAERNAKVIASILRPDGLPTGPRK